MPNPVKPKVAIVDYGLGNLFSVKHACEHAGLRAEITHARAELLAADAVILPGVGAFGHAMDALQKLKLVDTLREAAQLPKPLVGVCLGLQLLMTESSEFGRHAGLGIVPGQVVRFEHPVGPRGVLKVPQVGWNRIYRPPRAAGDPWRGTLLEGLADRPFMYFVHSYYVRPDDPAQATALASYGDVEFCAAIARGNVFACQYHPERSGRRGLQLYRNLAARLGAAR